MQDFPYETRKWYQSQDIKNHFVRFKYSYNPSSVDNERSFFTQYDYSNHIRTF